MKIEETKVLSGFIRLCNDGWTQGWHERNGGNATYRMKTEEVEECRSFFFKNDNWIPLDVVMENLAGEYFITTGTGKHFNNVILEPEISLGITEINAKGDAYRIVWGLNGGKDRPTSEFPTHLLNHSIKKAANPEYRMIYHAHPVHLIALTFVLPLDSKSFTKALWKTMTECPIIFPHGIAVLPWMVPGGVDIAKATSALVGEFDAVVWAHHGIFCMGTNFDTTFGLMHTIEKSAAIYMDILHTGKPILQTISDEQLLMLEEPYNVKLNRDFID